MTEILTCAKLCGQAAQSIDCVHPCREELDASPTILRYIARIATTEQYLYGRDALAAVQVSDG